MTKNACSYSFAETSLINFLCWSLKQISTHLKNLLMFFFSSVYFKQLKVESIISFS